LPAAPGGARPWSTGGRRLGAAARLATPAIIRAIAELRERVPGIDPRGEAALGPFIARRMASGARAVREDNIRPD
jgi:hypothetical protein